MKSLDKLGPQTERTWRLLGNLESTVMYIFEVDRYVLCERYVLRLGLRLLFCYVESLPLCVVLPCLSACLFLLLACVRESLRT